MISKKYLNHSWTDPRLHIGKSSISGKGIIASENINKGELLMIWGGVKIKKQSMEEEEYRMETLVPIDDDTYLGLPINDKTQSIDEYLNHSCDPNAWLVDEVTVVARRDIKKGEEITIDCVTWDADSQWSYLDRGLCKCGTKFCRRKLNFDDWKNPNLQKRYQGHFSPYIAEKIRNQKK